MLVDSIERSIPEPLLPLLRSDGAGDADALVQRVQFVHDCGVSRGTRRGDYDSHIKNGLFAVFQKYGRFKNHAKYRGLWLETGPWRCVSALSLFLSLLCFIWDRGPYHRDPISVPILHRSHASLFGTFSLLCPLTPR